jgi:hypothetical protein
VVCATVRVIFCMSLQLVAREYEELYPGEVDEVHLVRNTRELDPKVAEYEKLEQNLTDLLDDYTSKRRRHKTIKRKKVRQAQHR